MLWKKTVKMDKPISLNDILDTYVSKKAKKICYVFIWDREKDYFIKSEYYNPDEIWAVTLAEIARHPNILTGRRFLKWNYVEVDSSGKITKQWK